MVGMDGDFSASKWRGKKALLNQRVCRLLLKSDFFEKEFLFVLLRPYLDAIHSETSSVTVKHLSSKTISSIPLPLPPLKEQKRIVARIEALFSELDSGIAALKDAREQLKVYRQAVLKHAFDGKLTAQWRKDNADKLESPAQLLARTPAPEQPRGGRKASMEVIEGIAALAVNMPAKKQPDGWQWVPLLRVARQETGHTPSRKHPEYWGGDEYWVGIADARQHHGKIINNTIQKVTPAGLKHSSARMLPADTVVLSRTASVGYTAIMGKPMSTSQDFATWTCTGALEPKFLMYAVMAEGDEIRRFGKGTTHTTIYFPEIRALHICLPSVEEQKVIVESVENALQQTGRTLEEIETQLARAGTLRQSILKKAFAGELVPQDPDDEPASELLARIKAEKAERQAAEKAAKKAQRAASKKPAARRNARAKPGDAVGDA